ncbi:hypothetical protein Hrd1104_05320 [Halorhabdus sp. CBA1104]|uniref:hypothetical protein n=1 Tax=Halorhabdus sp. CBA1104 TaxID=1380432 RepID=UPI0012B3C5F5|nr:hypothetical protein [Halorhabdus sp. CBA1104]QGN06770.1 hypothetical protein Hrd1104_05320 [Halorhabdus sp. CBA1104]
MAERSDQLSRGEESMGDTDLEELLDTPEDAAKDATGPSGGRLARIRARLGGLVSVRPQLGRIFSIRSFLLALAGSVLGAIGFGIAIPFFDSLAALGGIFTAAFVAGVFGSRRSYLEFTLAGAATAALGTVSKFMVVAVVGQGELLAIFGAGSGAIAALLGHYFGRDLRTGMTTDIEGQ